ncbi:MAG: WcaF family extracellular polysaccharide biosynthesis acetyltransferase [Bacteroidetes bacterium]|nr:WcaF family extracellular polysaccharide biosynthesis acetyltransferase [Bacteroidota bacterium]
MKTDLSSFDNTNFSHGKSFTVRILWILMSRIFFETALPYPSAFKLTLLKLFGSKIGRNIVLKPSVKIKHPWLLSLGDNSWIGEQVWIDNLAQVTIKENVCISQGAMLLTGNHNYKSSSFDLMTGEIVLEEGVWIGAKSVVCPGITCASHSILTVGSIATKNLEPYSIYQGNPALKIKSREIK